jgi:hypothetical protein
MTAKEPKKSKRRIEARVSEHLGARLDRLAKVYGEREVPGADFKAHIALGAVLYAGVAAEEKRLGLPPLPEPVPKEPATVKPARAKRTSRTRTTRRR